MSEINQEQAELSASEWVGEGKSILNELLVSCIKNPKKHKNIGKILASASEIVVCNWLVEKTNRPYKIVDNKPYDIVLDEDGENKTRIQVKFRMGNWHLETTRRNSKKNKDTNSTGHVVYKVDEFDYLAIFKPSSTFGISDSKIRLIPVSALINPDKPDQLIPRINKNLRIKYDMDEMTEDILTLLS